MALALSREDLFSSLAVAVGLALAVEVAGGARTLVVSSLVSITTSAASWRNSRMCSS